ncbi:nucleotidyltransferase domain-containing protein [Tepidiforma flava]|uniref:Nucleotidyltransferase domain-containing protein n=1 Tax=Tepidiforma flava TaxID=3004094 RepID=A0ABY7M9I7_9CHLR|nr:nucleotidyltransferase domain-containing protein [Tepidiforma flava]WBL37194.1 nucleotidyltransferase domain-containing protein [Tepidiforma flava]
MDPRTRAIADWVVARLGGDPRIRRIILFGSRARGDARERSDVDLAIEAPGADPVAWDDILAALDEAPTLLQLDVVRLEDAPEALRAAIEREGIELHHAVAA